MAFFTWKGLDCPSGPRAVFIFLKKVLHFRVLSSNSDILLLFPSMACISLCFFQGFPFPVLLKFLLFSRSCLCLFFSPGLTSPVAFFDGLHFPLRCASVFFLCLVQGFLFSLLLVSCFLLLSMSSFLVSITMGIFSFLWFLWDHFASFQGGPFFPPFRKTWMPHPLEFCFPSAVYWKDFDVYKVFLCLLSLTTHYILPKPSVFLTLHLESSCAVFDVRVKTFTVLMVHPLTVVLLCSCMVLCLFYCCDTVSSTSPGLVPGNFLLACCNAFRFFFFLLFIMCGLPFLCSFYYAWFY